MLVILCCVLTFGFSHGEVVEAVSDPVRFVDNIFLPKDYDKRVPLSEQSGISSLFKQ